MTMTPTSGPALGDVAPDYSHQPKMITPAAGPNLPNAQLKWYDVRAVGATIDSGVRRLAHDFLREEITDGRLDLKNDLGFVILHRCGRSFHFLLVSVWRNNNELWETVYTSDDGPFHLVDGGATRATFCVWELGAVLHEQQAWTRYLYSARNEDALRAYLDDVFTGQV